MPSVWGAAGTPPPHHLCVDGTHAANTTSTTTTTTTTPYGHGSGSGNGSGGGSSSSIVPGAVIHPGDGGGQLGQVMPPPHSVGGVANSRYWVFHYWKTK